MILNDHVVFLAHKRDHLRYRQVRSINMFCPWLEVCISSHLRLGQWSSEPWPGAAVGSPRLDLLLQPEVRDLWIMVEHQHE